MTDTPDSLDTLADAARQVIETERALAGDVLPLGANPLPAPAPTKDKAVKADKTDTAEKAEKAKKLDEIAREVAECTACELCRQRNKPVPGEGNPDARIFFIGEGPGAEEDLQGIPFVGRAGQLLDKMIEAMGLTRQDVFIGNVVKCRPPGNRAPTPDETAACWDYLRRQIEIIAPEVIVVMGNAAAKVLLETRTGITRLRGQWHEVWGIPVMPTFHPAYVLRQYTPDNRRKVWSDLQAVMEHLGLK